MSRIGKVPVLIPEKVTVAVDGQSVAVEGPKGKVEKAFDNAVTIIVEDNQVVVKKAVENRFANAMTGTARSIINGMVEGVTKGFVKELEITGVGFKAAMKGADTLDLALGFSHNILYKIPAGIKITLKTQTDIVVEGIDKHMVGQVAASIKSFAPVEPYKGKGVHIKGEFVRRKEGKKTS